MANAYPEVKRIQRPKRFIDLIKTSDENQCQPKSTLIKTSDENLARIFAPINRFVKPKSLEISADVAAPKLAMTQIISGAEVYVPLEELIDLDEEIARLQGDLKKFAGEVKRAEGKLGNEKFVNNAPEAVVAEEREKLADWQAKLAATESRLEELKSAK